MENTQQRTGAGPVVDLYLRPIDNLLTVGLYAQDNVLELAVELWDESGLTVPIPQGPGNLDCNLTIGKVQTTGESLGAILGGIIPGLSTDDNAMRQAGYAEGELWSRTVGRAVGGIIVNNGADRVYYNTGGRPEVLATGDGIRAGCAPNSSSARWLEPGDSLVFGRASL